MAYKGKYKVKDISKYRGNPSNVIYRSSWERKVMVWLDSHPNVINWSSEEIVVPYISPLDNKIHRYFPDFVCEVKDKNGEVKTFMIEVKPTVQMTPPDPKRRNATKSGRVSRRYLNESKTYAVNHAKWEAARQYCKSKGWQFMLWGEKEIGVK